MTATQNNIGLIIDEFRIYYSQTITNLKAETLPINGLDRNSEYSWQVQGINCDGEGGNTEWSAVAIFNTVYILTKEITAYGSDKTGWYLIASPLAGSTLVTDVDNLTNNTYDLYRFNQNAELEWQNYKVHNNDSENPFNALVNGQGYLYANSSDVTLTFTGFPYSGNGEVTLLKDSEADLSGWNLVGNPFTETVYIDRPFYIMNEGGSEIIAATQVDRDYIEPMEGIFVHADEDGDTMTFYTQEPGKGRGPKPKPEQLVLNLSRDRGSVVDRAIIHFGEGQTLPKFQIRENSTKLYIPQGGKDYAIACVGRDVARYVSTMPINFKAKENGEYTITVKLENVEMEYLQLIDNMTGTDVDLLSPSLRAERSNPDQPASYTFTARTTDYESRFKLVFASKNEDSSTDNPETFAFYSNGDIIVNGEGIIQVIDMMGRVILTRTVTPHSSLQIPLVCMCYA